MMMFFLLLVCVLGFTWIIFFQLDIIRRQFSLSKQQYQLRLANMPREMKVIARKDMSEQHFSVCLKAVDKRPLNKFQAGQYLTLLAKTGLNQERVVQRCYSLASWQDTPDTYELGIQRETHGEMSNWLHENLWPGNIIQTKAPKGRFVLDVNNTQHGVLVAGGIGITPLRAMMKQFIAYKKKGIGTLKSLHLFYSAKSEENMCYLDEFLDLAEQCADFYFYPVFSQTLMNPSLNTPMKIGRLSASYVIQSLQKNNHTYLMASGCQYYMCGPDLMMDQMTSGLIQQGVDKECIHFERFGGAIDSADDNEYSVKIGSRENIVFHKQANLLTAFEQQGVNIESECRSGECGLCKITLLSGDITQRIKPEKPLGAGQYLACCSVPSSDLQIELS